MRFSTDKQTTNDLQIFGRGQEKSIFGIFDHTYTRGAAAILEQMFSHPLSDHMEINRRTEAIKFFGSRPLFPFDAEYFDIADGYLANTDQRTKLDNDGNSMKKRLSSLIVEDSNYRFVFSGVSAVLDILTKLSDWSKDLAKDSRPGISGEKLRITELLDQLKSTGLRFENQPVSKFSYLEIAELDVLLRFRSGAMIREVLGIIYLFDVYISVGKIAAKNGYSYAHAIGGENNTLRLENAYHPMVSNAVPNSFNMDGVNNVTFLTGANMAGKSTFMKSLGICLYLGHMGFPVPAAAMTFSVLDGIYTTINLSDNLGSGTSHFYAEVLRIKKVARELGQDKRLFVLIDELFRGTNVKDAYEATVAITEAFALRISSLFVISTHIIEAGPVIAEKCANVRFAYLPTVMEGNKPKYTYKVKEGVTADRHGMVIIENEGILEILRNGNKSMQYEI